MKCNTCGNTRDFLVKTLQVHVLRAENDTVEIVEESKPGVLEILCDECETALSFDEFEDGLRRELLLTLGAR